MTRGKTIKLVVRNNVKQVCIDRERKGGEGGRERGEGEEGRRRRGGREGIPTETP